MLKKITTLALLGCFAPCAFTTQPHNPQIAQVRWEDSLQHTLSRFMFSDNEKTVEKLEAILNRAAAEMSSEEFCEFLKDYNFFDFYRPECGGLLFDLIERIPDSETRINSILTVLKIAKNKLSPAQFLSVLEQKYHSCLPNSELHGKNLEDFAHAKGDLKAAFCIALATCSVNWKL